MTRVVALGLVLAASVLARAADTPPSPVEVRAHAEPDTVTVGSRFRYVVEVTSRPDAEVFVAQPSERVSDEFEIVDFGVEPPVTRAGKTVLTRWYTLVGFTPGDHLIKSPPVRYRQPGGEMVDAPYPEGDLWVATFHDPPGNVLGVWQQGPRGAG